MDEEIVQWTFWKLPEPCFGLCYRSENLIHLAINRLHAVRFEREPQWDVQVLKHALEKSDIVALELINHTIVPLT